MKSPSKKPAAKAFMEVGKKYLRRDGGIEEPRVTGGCFNEWILEGKDCTYRADGCGWCDGWGYSYRADIVARLGKSGKVLEVNPHLPADDEARARVSIRVIRRNPWLGGGKE